MVDRLVETDDGAPRARKEVGSGQVADHKHAEDECDERHGPQHQRHDRLHAKRAGGSEREPGELGRNHERAHRGGDVGKVQQEAWKHCIYEPRDPRPKVERRHHCACGAHRARDDPFKEQDRRQNNSRARAEVGVGTREVAGALERARALYQELHEPEGREDDDRRGPHGEEDKVDVCVVAAQLVDRHPIVPQRGVGDRQRRGAPVGVRRRRDDLTEYSSAHGSSRDVVNAEVSDAARRHGRIDRKLCSAGEARPETGQPRHDADRAKPCSIGEKCVRRVSKRTSHQPRSAGEQDSAFDLLAGHAVGEAAGLIQEISLLGQRDVCSRDLVVSGEVGLEKRKDPW
eukprot:2304229-Prymnesium_polylepis.1